MDLKDVPRNTWFRNGHVPAAYGYERWMFVTEIKRGSTRFCLDVSMNENHPKLEGGNSFLREGFWLHQHKNEIYVLDPPEKERIQRECIVSIWENLDT